jgi:hypothetical protein
LKTKSWAVWLDADDDGIADTDGYLGNFAAYQGPHTVAENYYYYSASAHPMIW